MAFDPLKYIKAKTEYRKGLQGVVIDDNYYSAQETTVSRAETTFYQSRGEYSIPARWGETTTVNIGLNDFIGETYLSIVLPLDNSGNYKFPIGWGLAAIEEIKYVFPASNISTQSITRSQIFSFLMGQNRDYTSTSLMMMLAGNGINYGSTITRLNRSARILLPFPWSSMDPQVKPIDLTLFKNAPLQIMIRLSAAFQVYSLQNSAPLLYPESATVDWRQGHLSDQNFSLKTVLMSNPAMSYGYPMTKSISYDQIYVAAQPTIQIPINGFLDADLLGMCIYVVENPKIPGVNSDALNMWELDPISNVTLTWNSEVMYRANNFDYRLNNFQSVHSCGYDISNTSFSASVACFPVFVDFSIKRSVAFCEHYYNTYRFGGQTMQLTFEPSITTGTFYNVYVTCFYNEVLEQSATSSNSYLM